MASLALRENQSKALDALKLSGTDGDAKRVAQELLESLRLFEVKELCQRLAIKMAKANKSALIQRLLAYGEMGLLEKGHLDTQQAAKAVSYLSDDMKAALDRLPPFESGDLSERWLKKLSGVLQSLTYPQVYAYLVELRARTDDERQRQSFKSMKGYSYFASGWVENVWLCKPYSAVASSGSPVARQDDLDLASQASPTPMPAGQSMLFSKGFVWQSFPSRDKHPYPVFVCLDVTGRVYKAKCSCAAGLGESCSHIAALLFFLLDCHEKGMQDLPESVTCTGRAMAWNRPPPHKEVQPVRVSDMIFTKAEYGKASRSVSGGSLDNFDPRPCNDQEMDDGALQALLNSVQSSFPQSALLQFHGVAPATQAPVPEHTEVEQQVRDLIVPRVGCLVQDGTDLDSVAEVLCADFIGDQVISDELSARIETLTVEQGQSPLWHDLRVGRLTSSLFHDVLVRRPSTSPEALVKRVMGYSPGASTAGMQWGIAHEPSAIRDYVAYMQSSGHPHLQHQPSGLTLLPSMSFLGASADGEVTDPFEDDPHGLVEVKCPNQCQGNKSVRFLTPREITEAFPQQACLELTPAGKLQLKRSHRYYTQVQGELGVKRRAWADFVVWTAAKSDNVFVERIFLAEQFWEKLLAALIEFYESSVAPEILFRQMQAALSSSVTQPQRALLPNTQHAETAKSADDRLSPVEKCCSNCAWPASLSLRHCIRCTHKFHHLCTSDDEGKKCRCCCLQS